jgi:hypothetical protein
MYWFLTSGESEIKISHHPDIIVYYCALVGRIRPAIRHNNTGCPGSSCNRVAGICVVARLASTPHQRDQMEWRSSCSASWYSIILQVKAAADLIFFLIARPKPIALPTRAEG